MLTRLEQIQFFFFFVQGYMNLQASGCEGGVSNLSRVYEISDEKSK